MARAGLTLSGHGRAESGALGPLADGVHPGQHRRTRRDRAFPVRLCRPSWSRPPTLGSSPKASPPSTPACARPPRGSACPRWLNRVQLAVRYNDMRRCSMAYAGVVKGSSIELQERTPYADGERVSVEIQPIEKG